MDQQIKYGGGYEPQLGALNKKGSRMSLAARVYEPQPAA
jgi:hypothetical protein